MKQLVVLSGKGGTGKTSVTAGFAHLASQDRRAIRAVLADADVDASNLELVLHPKCLEEHDFVGGAIAKIDPELCEGCGTCSVVCKFDAVISPDGEDEPYYRVDPYACEGCAACMYQCPEEAIKMMPQTAGHWYRSQTMFGPLFHAILIPGQENSGKLVTLVKEQARLLAEDGDYSMQIVDGPPGIGCPVISAITGADMVLVVTEPTLSGVHDLERILDTTRHFKVPSKVCINKADLYPESAEQIEAFCKERGVDVVGSIPFDKTVVEAMVQGDPVTCYKPDTPASQSIQEIWRRISDLLLL